MSQRSQPGHAYGAFARAAACAVIGASSTFASAHDTEAQRLGQIRAMIAREPHGQLTTTSGMPSGADASSCEAMREDLLKWRNFQPVEPVAIIDHEFPVRDPDRPIDQDLEKLPSELKRRAQRARNQLGRTLTSAVKSCFKAEAEGDERRGARLFTGLNSLVGAPPYRVYTIPPRLNPFPEAKIIYWSEYIESVGSGRIGYSWVDLNKCEHVSGIPVGTEALSLRLDPRSQQSALTIYQGRVIVSWTSWINREYQAYVLKIPFVSEPSSISVCSWSTVENSSHKK